MNQTKRRGKWNSTAEMSATWPARFIEAEAKEEYENVRWWLRAARRNFMCGFFDLALDAVLTAHAVRDRARARRKYAATWRAGVTS